MVPKLLVWRFLKPLRIFIPTGRQNDAHKAMQWLRGPSYSIEAEIDQIKTRVLDDSREAPKLSDFYQPGVFKPILIGVALMILQQFSGLNAASFNASEIFRIADLDFNRLIGVVVISAVQVRF
jgi:SP family facilitated glucose transporter-like MFS transporter 8